MQFPEEQTLKIKLFPDLISFSSEESNENTHLPIEIQKETFPIDQLEEIYKKIVSHKIKEAFIQYNQGKLLLFSKKNQLFFKSFILLEV